MGGCCWRRARDLTMEPRFEFAKFIVCGRSSRQNRVYFNAVLGSKLRPSIRQPSVAALVTCEAVETVTGSFDPKVQISSIARKPHIFVNGCAANREQARSRHHLRMTQTDAFSEGLAARAPRPG